MKIAMVTDTYYPQLNGVSVSVDNFSSELKALGHEVTIIAPKIGKYKDKKANIIRLPSLKILSSAEPALHIPFPIPDKNFREFYHLDFDIVHAHGNGAFSLLAYQLARMKNIPYVLTFHTVLTEYTHYILNGKIIKPSMIATGLKFFANRCDGIITPSEKMKLALNSYGVKKSISVIPNILLEKNFKKEKSNYLRKRFSIPKESKILLSVGRLGKEKNFTFIIEVFEQLSKKDKNSNLVIVGPGPEKQKLQNLVIDKKLENRIHFTGKVQRNLMSKVYGSSDIFIFASTTEAQGLVVLEAAAAGLPLITVDDLAFKNVVVNNVNGYTSPLDIKIFVDKLLYLIKNEKLMNEMGEESLKIVPKNFSAEIYTKKLIKLYESLILKQKSKTSKIKKSYLLSKKALRKLILVKRAFNMTFR